MIDWSAVEVGDVVEWRNGERMKLPPRELDQWEVFHDDGKPVLRFGHTCYDGDEIRAIHKKGTPGAMSHEERSRLWDEVEEHGIQIAIHGHDFIAWSARGHEAIGPTRLEAVAKCVAAIEQQQACERHARGE